MNKLLIIAFAGLVGTSANGWAQEHPPTWARHTIDNASSGADGIKLADINQDGRMDLVTGWEEGGITKLYLHPEKDKVTQPWPSVTVGKTPYVEDAVFADMNHDGQLDIVSSTENTAQTLFIHLPQSTSLLDTQAWQQVALPASQGRMMWMYAEPLQIDGQYGVDLVAAGKESGAAVGWFEAPKEANDWDAWTWHTISPVGWVMSAILRDMDGDGDTDVVISDRKGVQKGCRWLENPGPSAEQRQEWKNHFIGAEGREVMFMTMADVDGDGTEEAVVAERTNHAIRIYRRQDRAGTQWEEQIVRLPLFTGRAKSVAVGDMNGDGVADLVHSSSTEVLTDQIGLTWADGTSLSDPCGAVFQPISETHRAKYDEVVLMDADEDGDLDVLTCEENYGTDSQGLGVIWYENPAQ